MTIEVFTDGACLGNPGPGGWAFVVDQGPWSSGYEPQTTNQRMELTAASAAVQALEGPVRVWSDSTYVVNCFRQEWWKGWLKRGWKNSKKEPVANRDLWEPFIELVNARGDVEFEWVKGHSGHRLNEAADQLATTAAAQQASQSGGIYTDAIVRGLSTDDAAKSDSSQKDAAHSIAVFGHRPTELGGYGENTVTLAVRRQLIDILRAKLEMHSDVQVLTGLGLGAEMLAAEAAAATATPYVVVLAFEGVELRWPDATQKRFQELIAGARSVTTVNKENPKTAAEYGKALGRRDDAILGRATEAVLIRNANDRTLGDLQRKLERQFQEDVWIIDPE
jgi:ribonuclease HI